MERLKNSIPVINLDTRPPERRKVALFPNTMRCIIAGGSGSGKTNLLLTILLHRKPLANIYLCCKTSEQEKYKLLEELVAGYNEKNKRKKLKYHVISEVEKLPLPENVERNSVIIFDDILTEKQDRIANFFLRGRHRCISTYYVTQCYTCIPKSSGIRENINYLLLFKQDSVNLRQIYTECISGLIEYSKFKSLCEQCWRDRFGFLTIDLDNNTFKKNFEQQWRIN